MQIKLQLAWVVNVSNIRRSYDMVFLQIQLLDWETYAAVMNILLFGMVADQH